MFLDDFAVKNSIVFSKNKYHSMFGEGLINGEKVILLKPTTYMNLSGQAVREIVKSLKLDLKDLLIIYDDIDLPVANIRTRNSGSAGTHNGMRNITQELNSTDFARIRIGIGKPQFGDLKDNVLSKIKGESLELLKAQMPKVNAEIENFIKNNKLEEKTIK